MKNKYTFPKYVLFLLFLFLGLSTSGLFAQDKGVGIGTTLPDASAILHIQAEDQGVLFPRLDQSQQENILNPASGLLIYNKTFHKIMFNDSVTTSSTNWQPIGLWNRDVGSNEIYYDGPGAIKDLLSFSSSGSDQIAGATLGEIQFKINSGLPASIEGFNDVGGANNAGLRFFTSYDFNNAKLERLRIDREGRIGIGTTAPKTKLSISPTTTEAKITLWDNGGTTNHYGFGVSSNQLNYHVDGTPADHVFYAAGKNGNGTELMRIKGTKKVELLGNADATGSTGSGVLEIAGTLRIDGNEIITNTSSDLFLQSDNGGNLYVSGGALRVNSSGYSSFNTAPEMDAGLTVRGVSNSDDAHFQVQDANGVNVLKVQENGELFIGTIPVWNNDSDYDATWSNLPGTGSIASREGSSKRYKKNISPFIDDFSNILKIAPKKYKMKKGYGNPDSWLYGYIAEEMDQAGLEKLVLYDDKGRPDGVKYNKLAIYVLEVAKQNVETIQVQEEKIEELEETVARLLNQQKQVEKTLAAMEKQLTKISRSEKAKEASVSLSKK